MRSPHAPLAGLLVLALGVAPAQGDPPPRYEIFDLGDFGGELANATGLSENGIACGAAEVPSFETRAFIVDSGLLPGAPPQDLGSIMPGVTAAFARGISRDGRYVVGDAFTDSSLCEVCTIAHPFLWSADQGMIDLFPGDTTRSGIARGVNSSGAVVGRFGQDAFIWSPFAPPLTVRLPGTSGGADLEDINENFLAVGNGLDKNFDFVAFTFDPFTSRLTVLPHLEAEPSEARALNDAGDVVGRSDLATRQTRPVLWRFDESSGRYAAPVDLGFIIGPGNAPNPRYLEGTATAISTNGTIVGTDSSVDHGEQNKGWIRIDGVNRDLRTLIIGPARAEWDHITFPLGVNDEGMVAGIGIRNGVPGRAFLMRPLDCPADLTADGATDVMDFSTLAANFGSRVEPNTGGDLDYDADVDVFDFALLAQDFGCGRN